MFPWYIFHLKYIYQQLNKWIYSHPDWIYYKYERKYLENMQNNHFQRVKNSLLELGKYFTELANREIKDRKEEIKREIEELLHKSIIV